MVHICMCHTCVCMNYYSPSIKNRAHLLSNGTHLYEQHRHVSHIHTSMCMLSHSLCAHCATRWPWQAGARGKGNSTWQKGRRVWGAGCRFVVYIVHSILLPVEMSPTKIELLCKCSALLQKVFHARQKRPVCTEREL